MSDTWGKLRSAVAAADLEGLGLTGLTEDAVRAYLVCVPTEVLET